MAAPNSRDTLIDYALRNLGEPVITINVDREQCEDRLDEALAFFVERHFDGVEKVFFRYQITQTDLNNKYLTVSNIGGWDENRWDIDCNDFDDESYNRTVEDQLDKILEKMEDSDDFVDVNKYSEIFDRISKNYNLNHKYKTKTGREFFIRNIDPATNKIIVQVNKKEGGLEYRSYTEEEFNNFLVSPELFEGFIRIN